MFLRAPVPQLPRRIQGVDQDSSKSIPVAAVRVRASVNDTVTQQATSCPSLVYKHHHTGTLYPTMGGSGGCHTRDSTRTTYRQRMPQTKTYWLKYTSNATIGRQMLQHLLIIMYCPGCKGFFTLPYRVQVFCSSCIMTDCMVQRCTTCSTDHRINCSTTDGIVCFESMKVMSPRATQSAVRHSQNPFIAPSGV